MVKKLSEEQKNIIRKELVKDGIPVRFLLNGAAMDIITGDLTSKGSNVIYHPTYFNFTKETSKKIAKWLDAKAVFSSSEGVKK